MSLELSIKTSASSSHTTFIVRRVFSPSAASSPKTVPAKPRCPMWKPQHKHALGERADATEGAHRIMKGAAFGMMRCAVR
jgi:hypothetical protein